MMHLNTIQCSDTIQWIWEKIIFCTFYYLQTDTDVWNSHVTTFHKTSSIVCWGFPGGTRGEESAGQCRSCRFKPWVEDPLEKEMANLPNIFAWEIPQRSLAGCSPWDDKSQTWLSTLTATVHCCSVTKVTSDSFLTPWAVASRVPLSMRFSRQE